MNGHLGLVRKTATSLSLPPAAVLSVHFLRLASKHAMVGIYFRADFDTCVTNWCNTLSLKDDERPTVFPLFTDSPPEPDAWTVEKVDGVTSLTQAVVDERWDWETIECLLRDEILVRRSPPLCLANH